MITRLLSHCLLLCLLLSPLGGLAQDYSHVFVFGDSLSDTGNLASIIGPFPDPPYYMNRVSNGPVAVETVATGLNLRVDPSLHLIGPALGTNYAVAGARAHSNEPIDLANQVNAFLFNHGGVAPPEALYVVFIGGNDIRDARRAPHPGAAYQLLRQAVSAVDRSVRELIAAGACSLLVVNAPDIGLVPETRLLAAGNDDPQLLRRMSHYSQWYNHGLQLSMQRIEREHDLAIAAYDLFDFLGNVVANGASLGFTNTQDACFSSLNFEFHPDCQFGANFDAFVFFDELHPTARVNALAGEGILAASMQYGLLANRRIIGDGVTEF